MIFVWWVECTLLTHKSPNEAVEGCGWGLWCDLVERLGMIKEGMHELLCGGMVGS